MRIALFTGAYNHIADGVSLTLNRLVAYLERQGAMVQVHAPTVPHPPVQHAGTLVAVPSVAAPGRPEYRISVALPRRARAALAAFRPTLVHIATPDYLGVRARHLARAWNLPLVASYHTHFSSYLQYYGLRRLEPLAWRYLRWFYAACEHTYVPTPSMAAVLRRHGVGRDLRLWPRGVDTALFTPARRSASWRRALGIADGEVVVTFVSRVVREKGLDVFAAVIEGLIARGIPHRSMVVGDGPARAELQARLPHTRFTGHLGGEELARAYASSDVFLFPSDTETFGNVTLEAMACGLPAVCADATGSDTLVRHGITGFLAPPREPGGFLEHVAALVGDAELRRRMGAAAHRAAQAYDWERTLATIAGYYEEVLRGRPAAAAAPRRLAVTGH